MKLYFFPGACSLAPHIVLREAGLDFDLEKVDLHTKLTASGTPFATISPKSQVPVLVLDDGSVLTEVPVILQYLADQTPDAELAPRAGTLQRYRLHEWLNFVSSELHKGLSPLFRPDLPAAWRQNILDTVAVRLDHLQRHLAHETYLLDGRFSVADSYAFTIVNWSNFFRIDLARWPAVQRYMQRIAARPAVRAALQAEGLQSEPLAA